MDNINIEYCGPVFDASGYAQFARNFCVGLSRLKNVNLTIDPISFEKNKPKLTSTENIINQYVNKKIDRNIRIINAIPDSLPTLANKDTTNVCFTMFETTRIPTEWVRCLNIYAQACFVPCSWNKEVFKNSGVTIPIYVVPAGMDITGRSKNVKDIQIANLDESSVSFYSIFQWTERKHPAGLILSYLSAFDGVEDVALILKTYGSDLSIEQQNRIANTIRDLKTRVRCKAPPKIIFIGNLLSNDQIMGLHKKCDCFVLAHRAEGFGMPHCEALSFGKPVITTGFSGNMDFMNKSNSYLLDYQMTVVANMPWIPYYESDMEWAEPNLSQLKHYMRLVYSQVKEARNSKDKDSFDVYKKARKGKEDMEKYYTLENTAKILAESCRKVLNDVR